MSEGRCSPDPAAAVWVLLGHRAGDNNQLLAVAQAVGLPYRVVSLDFERRVLPNVLRGASLSGLRNPHDVAGGLPQRAPRLVLGIGRRSPPVARWIRARAGSAVRLVHFGRPWGPTQWFDLIVTTPQYELPARPNVLCNLLPFVPEALPADGAALPAAAAGLPRPWTVLLVGGPSRPYDLDPSVVAALVEHANRRVACEGGSLLVVTSPRTPPHCLPLLAGRFSVPAHVWQSGGGQANPYRTLLAVGDRFIVTSDSVSMAAEVLAAGKPIEIYPLPQARGDWRYAAAARCKRAAVGHPQCARAFAWLVDRGLITSTRNLDRFYQCLAEHGVLAAPEVARELAVRERAATLARIGALLVH